MAKKVAICTLGCKVNIYESEAVIRQFESRDYICVDFDECADVYIINTCTVTHLSDRKSRQMIRRTKQINPSSILVVMGCYAQVAPCDISEIPEVDIIIGTDKKANVYETVCDFLKNKKKLNLVCDISDKHEFEELEVTSYEGRTRAFLKVQDGCNNFCSYCIIPYARGRIRSRSLQNALTEAKRLAEHGFTEIVLVGIHLASYGKDTGESLVDLLKGLNSIDGISRIRMGSLEPTLFDEEFVEKISSLEKICHHFHLSLQSGCDETLKRMNRKYKTQDYRDSVNRLRKAFPDVAITTDVMVGFPGETDEEFEKSLKFAEEIAFSEAHIFKYSVRKGTAAEKMDNQVSPQIKEERSKRLTALTNSTKNAFLEEHTGKTTYVLFEQEHKNNAGLFEGKTDNYITVVAKSNKNISGKIKQVRIDSIKNGIAMGTILD